MQNQYKKCSKEIKAYEYMGRLIKSLILLSQYWKINNFIAHQKLFYILDATIKFSPTNYRNKAGKKSGIRISHI